MKLYKYIFLFSTFFICGCSNLESKSGNEYKIEEEHKLSEFIDENQIEKVMIRNVKGPHYLTTEQWNKLKFNILNSISKGKGLICKPQWLGFIFELKNGEKIEGTVCGDLINFENELSRSFKMKEEINFHNY